MGINPVDTISWAFAGILAYLISKSLYNLYFHPLAGIPGPPLWQILHLRRLIAALTGTLEHDLLRLHDSHGPVVRYSPNELSFSSSTAWRDIYGFGSRALPKEDTFYGHIRLARDGSHSIFTADGAAHPRIRKALSYAFSEKALRAQEPRVKVYVDALIANLQAKSGQVVDLVDWFNFTTFDIIGDLAIGQSFDCLHDGAYHDWVHGIMSLLWIGAIVRAAAVAIYAGLPSVLRGVAPARIKRTRQRHLAFVGEATERRLTRGSDARRPDFISYILAQDEKGEDVDEKLSSDELEANANFLLLAGTETTATALSGITFYLLRRPDALRRAVNEVRDAFAVDGGEAITFAACAERLPYLHACILEGLRLYPPGPIAPPRRVPHDRPTTIAGHFVPGGTMVGVHTLSASRSAANFSRANEFLPERWRASSALEGDTLEASQPFSYGPRNCLGRPFAMAEMRVILARVLWALDLELMPESWNWEEKQRIFTLWDKGPLLVRVRKRE